MRLPIVLTNNAAAAAAVSLVEGYNGYYSYNSQLLGVAQGYYIKNWYWGVAPTFSNVIEKANVFEEGIKNAITFEEGKQTPVGGSIVVRVSPANYEPQPEDFQFVNSLGYVFEGIKVVDVEPYDGLLVKSTTETGLWLVDIVLEEYDEEYFYAMSGIDTNDDGYIDRKISYAVKVGDAVSTYDLDFTYQDFTPLDYLDFFVGANLYDAQYIGALNNRYQGTYAAGDTPGGNLSLKQPGETKYEELTWTTYTDDVPTPAVEPVFTPDAKKNVQVDAADDRHDQETYKAVLGEDINIYAGYWYSYPDDFRTYSAIKAMYVTLDSEDNAIESAPSEWNAWTSYVDGIEGLNEVQLGPVATITINKKSADGDIIGFRVYAVNLDGTLVDPDGRAFYVQVGKAGDELDGINTVMNTIEQFQTPKSAVAKASTKKITAASWTFAMAGKLATGDNIQGNFVLAKEEGDGTDNVIVASAPNASATATIDLSTIKTAYFVPTYDDDGDDEVDLWAYVDDYTYVGEFTFYNAEGFVVATLPVSFTKTLPASIAEVPVKTSQLAGGTYRCFLIPTNWQAYDDVASAEKGADGTKGTADDQQGAMDMLSIFNFPNDDPTGYEVTFAASVKATESGKTVLKDVTVVPDTKLASDDLNDPTVAPNNWITITDLDLIDNKTEHKTTVVYNMGQVSSAKIKWDTTTTPATVDEVGDYTIPAGEFQTIYFCIYNDDATYGWPWEWNITKAQYKTLFGDAFEGQWKNAKSAPSIVYEDFDGKTIDPTYIAGQSKWDSVYKGTMPNGYNTTIKIQDVKLVTASGANEGKVEYYDVDTAFTFTKKSGATNPTTTVPSKLVITYTDMYGHENEAKLDANVMHR